MVCEALGIEVPWARATRRITRVAKSCPIVNTLARCTLVKVAIFAARLGSEASEATFTYGHTLLPGSVDGAVSTDTALECNLARSTGLASGGKPSVGYHADRSVGADTLTALIGLTLGADRPAGLSCVGEEIDGTIGT